MPLFRRHHKRTQPRSWAPSQWSSSPSTTLAVTAFFFLVLNHAYGAAAVGQVHFAGPYLSQDEVNCFYYPPSCPRYLPPIPDPVIGADPPPPATTNPVTPSTEVLSPPPPAATKQNSSHPPPAPIPPAPTTSPGAGNGKGNNDELQQKGKPQISNKSAAKVAATVGWVFLAAAALMQVALGGFLAYKRWELERYGARLEEDPASGSPHSPTP